MKDLQEQIDKLKAEKTRIRKRRGRREAENEKDWKLEHRIGDKILILEMKLLEGKKDAVVVRYRRHSKDRSAYLNDARGTITKVKRTRAIVKFDNDEMTWDFPLSELMPAEKVEQQGMCLYSTNL